MNAATLSPSQATRLLAIGVLLKEGVLTLSGRDAAPATEALVDIAEEVALQAENGR